MPFTPLHMGPAIALKAVTGRHFSLTVFGFSQVAMDIEPLVRIVRGDLVLHGFTHTYAGATLIGLACALAGRPLCQWLLKYWQAVPGESFMNWLRGESLISRPAAIAGAFTGTFSHVALDSIMHADMQPLAPLRPDNPMLHLITVDSLHLLCLLGGIMGALWMTAMYFIGRARHSNI